MSFPGGSLALTAAEAGGLILLQSFGGRVARSLGGIVAQVTIEEESHDQLIVTEHPVEQGASITDHAYKRPATVVVRAAWSNSPSAANTGLLNIPGNIFAGLASTAAAFAGPSSYVNSVYDRLLALQASRQPFTVVTGKRTYTNMLFESIRQTTDEKTNDALFVVAVCKQIVIVQTQIITTPPRSVQKTPQLNAPVENMGAKQLVPGV